MSSANFATLTAEHGDRFLLGIGVSHAPLIDAGNPGRYRKPLAATASFLDELDATPQPVPVQRRVLAALGPKMLELSARRGAGAHPYLVTPEHTATARGVLGDGPLLLPEQTVILTDSADDARAIGTDWLRSYLALPNYANNLRRLAVDLPLDAIVLETDSPDIPPAWIGRGRNAPGELPRIAQTLADLRGLDIETVARTTTRNARTLFGLAEDPV